MEYEVIDRDGRAQRAGTDKFTFVLPDSVQPCLRINLKTQGVQKPLRTWDLPGIENLRVDRGYELELARAGRLPEVALANGAAADVTAVFQPFGTQPLPGATFLWACPEVLTKPGAKVNLFMEASLETTQTATPPPLVRWEYWNGTVWAPLPDLKATPEVLAFCKSGEIQFTVPQNVVKKKEFGQEQLWVRAHLASGGYLVVQGGTVLIDAAKQNFGKYDKTFPPSVRKFRVEYEYVSPAEAAAAFQSVSDFRWTDRTAAAKFGGLPFEPFHSAEEARPTLYLGFTRALPSDLISLFFNVERTRREPDLVWEYHDGRNWRRLVLDKDETAGLSQPGLVQFVWPGTPLLPDPEPVIKAEGKTIMFADARVAARFRQDDVIAVFENDSAEAGIVAESAAGSLTLTAPLETEFSTSALAGVSPLPRFGAPRHWVRVVWPRVEVPMPGDADAIRVSGLFLNSVWAEQTKTIANELLGATTGMDGESFVLADRPVLVGEKVELLELSGPLAEAGSPALQRELKAGMTKADLTLENDEKRAKPSAPGSAGSAGRTSPVRTR